MRKKTSLLLMTSKLRKKKKHNNSENNYVYVQVCILHNIVCSLSMCIVYYTLKCNTKVFRQQYLFSLITYRRWVLMSYGRLKYIYIYTHRIEFFLSDIYIYIYFKLHGKRKLYF